MRYLYIFPLMVLLVSSSFAFKCYITLAKGSCWKNYDVNVYISGSSANDKTMKVTIPKGKLWTRQAFECQPKDFLRLSADFSPVFWSSDEGRKYNAKDYWSLPDSVRPGEKAWSVSFCFAEQFSEVPMPPDSTDSCLCDMQNIPDVPKQK